jgi:hypothetical protein
MKVQFVAEKSVLSGQLRQIPIDFSRSPIQLTSHTAYENNNLLSITVNSKFIKIK